ncbi:MAG: hypothetical protein FJ096_00140 [Deltaproteobacteria bacterium]|nr:hypothetical protein [Deltaproteobacteria bacterium]
MRHRAISLVLATSLGLAAFGGRAYADETTAQQTVAAEVLFEEGLELKKAGKFLEAAKKLEQAQRVDPGIGTLLHLADAFERGGKLASAWGSYKEAAGAAQKARDPREKLANDLAGKLAGKLARLSLDLGSNASLPGLVVARGTVELAGSMASVPIPVDAGTLVVEVRAPGHLSFREELSIKDGDQRTLTVPPLEPKPEEPVPAGVDTGASNVPPPSSGPPTSRSTTTPLQHKLRYGSLALGLGAAAGAGVATAFLIRAIQFKDQSAPLCDATTCTTLEGEALTNDALHAARIATTATVVAGAAGAGALGLLIGSFAAGRAPERKDVAWAAVPWFDGRAAGLTVGGSFR